MKSIQIKRNITDRSSLSLNDYLKDISKISVMSPEQEKEVALKAKEGDKKAFDKLVTSNLRFVVSVAKQYQGQGLSLEDLINEGNIGLIKAAHRFDVSRGYRFISYAVWWIKQSIISALSEQSRTIRLPMNQVSASSRIIRFIAEFEQHNDRPPTNDEIEEALSIPADKIDKILNSNNKIISFDTPFSSDSEDGTLIDVIPNKNIPKTDSELLKESVSLEIANALNKLKDREHDIIRMYFGLGCTPQTLDAIGDKFGITNERARQIKEEALAKLRTKFSGSIKNILT